MLIATRFLFLCASVLVLPAIVVAQPPPPSPGWYSNGITKPIYEDSSGLRIVWGNSYIYPHPGKDPLYWYAEVVYLNTGTTPYPITCVGLSNPSLTKEQMRGTPNAGYVPAEETFCSRNPNWAGSIKPGGAHFSWAIFHNVPWTGGQVALEWGSGPHGLSPWVDPWYVKSPSNTPPPIVCPPELVTLGTCTEVVPPVADNLPLFDIVRTVVSGWKAICDIRECTPSTPLNVVAFLNKVFSVLNLGALQARAVQFINELMIVNKAIAEHGPKSPEVRREILGPLCQSLLNLHNAVLTLGINRAAFPPPVERCNAN